MSGSNGAPRGESRESRWDLCARSLFLARRTSTSRSRSDCRTSLRRSAPSFLLSRNTWCSMRAERMVASLRLFPESMRLYRDERKDARSYWRAVFESRSVFCARKASSSRSSLRFRNSAARSLRLAWWA